MNDTSSENPENPNPIQTTPVAEAAEAEVFEHEASTAPFYDYSPSDHDYPVEDSAEMPPPPDWEHAVPADTAEAEAEEDSDDEDDTQFAPLPEFSTENWAAIVRHFARKLGAAQMLAQHAAWTNYDADSHLMMLSMTDEAQ